MSSRVLVFPAGMPRSLAFLEQALQDGRDVIGSSSLLHDPARDRYPAWCHLPFVTDDAFSDALRQAVAQHRIDAIFTPNIVVWNYLERGLGDICPGVALLNSSPLEREVLPYQKALAFAKAIQAAPIELGASGQPRAWLGTLQTASIFHHAELIPGMCDHEKIQALFSIFRHAPQGDVVEIGSWWGKSAFVLGLLAKSYDTGNVLCVDPWTTENMKQGDSKGLVDSVDVDTDGALDIFQINLLPYFEGRLNYFRLPSLDASRLYRQDQVATSATFGTTRYTGKIAVLHIDGNHSYDNVREDAECWADLVVPGGWIIFDDYVWPYGDGPQRVGDAYLTACRDKIDVSFVMGSALFVRKSLTSS